MPTVPVTVFAAQFSGIPHQYDFNLDFLHLSWTAPYERQSQRVWNCGAAWPNLTSAVFIPQWFIALGFEPKTHCPRVTNTFGPLNHGCSLSRLSHADLQKCMEGPTKHRRLARDEPSMLRRHYLRSNMECIISCINSEACMSSFYQENTGEVYYIVRLRVKIITTSMIILMIIHLLITMR